MILQIQKNRAKTEESKLKYDKVLQVVDETQEIFGVIVDTIENLPPTLAIPVKQSVRLNSAKKGEAFKHKLNNNVQAIVNNK